MKRAIIIAYWFAAIILTAFLLMSLEYDLGQAVLMGLSFLPAAMALSFFLPKVERESTGKKRILDTVCIILGVMLMTFLFIYIWQLMFISLFDEMEYKDWALPSMLGNPVFVAAILWPLSAGEMAGQEVSGYKPGHIYL